MADHLDLCTLAGLGEAVAFGTPGQYARLAPLGTFDGTYCPSCNDVRRMNLVSLFWEDRWAPGRQRDVQVNDRIFSPTIDADSDPTPALYLAQCVQCDGQIILLVFNGPNGLELVSLPSTYGGLATPNTPRPVAFYLDQAQRSQAVGALSAAVTMYRSALEHLLEHQGYTDRMLGPKINALLADQAAPGWRDALDFRLPSGDQGSRECLNPCE